MKNDLSDLLIYPACLTAEVPPDLSRRLPRCGKKFDFGNRASYYFCTTVRVAPFQPDR